MKPFYRHMTLLCILVASGTSSFSCQRTKDIVASAAPKPADDGLDSSGVNTSTKDPWSSKKNLIEAPAAAPAKPVNLPRVRRESLSNGLLVRLVHDSSWPVVNIHLVVLGGTDQEPMGKRGLANFAAQMLTKGTWGKSADEIAQEIDFVGGRLRTWADLDGTHVVCQVLSKDIGTCLELVPDIVMRPTFPEKEIGVVADRLITMVKNVRDVDRRLVAEHFENMLWGDSNIRGWPKTIKSINSIDRPSLVKWHQTWFKPNNSVLAIAGDVDLKKIIPSLNGAFGDWKRGKLPTFKAYPAPKIQGVRIRLVDKPDQTQTQIRLGHLGLEHKHPDYLAVSLVSYVLGGGAFSSRLMKVIRAKGGKTYGAKSSFDKEAKRGEFWIWTFTRTSETVSTLKMVLSEMERMRTGGPSQEELADAKSNMAGSYPMNFETSEDVADAVLSAELHGLSEGAVRQYPLVLSAVSLQDAKRAAREYLHPDDLVIAMVGKASEIEAQLKKSGFSYEKVGYLEPTTATERLAQKAQLDTPADPEKTSRGKRLLDEAIVAAGGKKALDGIEDIYMEGKGSIEAMGQKFQVQIRTWFKLPDRRRVELKMPMGTVVSIVSPEGVWSGLAGMVKSAPANVADKERASFWRSVPMVLLRHLDRAVGVQARDKIRENGRELDVVEIWKEDKSLAVSLRLDSKTHLLSSLRYNDDGVDVVEGFSDYRDVGGTMMAFHRTRKGQGGQKVEVKMETIKINKGISSDLFTQAAKDGAESQRK